MNNIVDKKAVEAAIGILIDQTGRFSVSDIVKILDAQGNDFGETGVLLQAAKFQKVRVTISQLRDSSGKRKYVSTATQLTLGFETEQLYCTAVTSEVMTDDAQSLKNLIIKRIIGHLKRTSIVPDEIVIEIAAILEKWRTAV